MSDYIINTIQTESGVCQIYKSGLMIQRGYVDKAGKGPHIIKFIKDFTNGVEYADAQIVLNSSIGNCTGAVIIEGSVFLGQMTVHSSGAFGSEGPTTGIYWEARGH